MTVNGAPSIRTARPTAAGSAPSARRQNPSLTTTMGSAPGRSSAADEPPAEGRLDAEGPEEIGGDERAGHAIGRAAGEHVEPPPAVECQSLEPVLCVR